MGNDLIPQETFLPGIAPQLEAAEIARSFHVTELEFGEKYLDRLPTDDERKTLSNRMAEINMALTPAGQVFTFEDKKDLTQSRLGRAILWLFSSYNNVRNPEELCLLYVADLQDLPAFAVEQAVDDIKHNRVFDVDKYGKRTPLNMDFVPNSVRVRAATDKHMESAWKEKLQIDRVLTLQLAPAVLPDEQRHEMAQNFRNLAAHLNMRQVTLDAEADARRDRVRRETAERNNERIAEQWKAAGLTPLRAGSVLVSPSLAAKVAQWKADDVPHVERHRAEEAERVKDRQERKAPKAKKASGK